MPQNSEEPRLPPLQEQAIAWLVRLRTHALSEAETREFADWLSQDLSNSEAFAKAEDLFDVMSQAVQLRSVSAKPNPNTLPDRVQPAAIALQRKRNPLRWLAMPLALAASWLFAVNLVLPEKASLLDTYLSDYHTRAGEQRSIQLADGSQLLMNTNTAVSADINGNERHITLLHGQAQFTVAADTVRPFTVSAGELQLRALGTVFEVYRKTSGDIEVSVQEHAVAASFTNADNHPPTPPITVQQGQQLRYNHGNGYLMPPQAINDEIAGAWRQRRVIVKDRPLAELVAEIERYRQGRIFLGGDSLKNLRVTGLFSLADPNLALAKVQKILGLKETRLGPWWIVLHR